MNSNFDYIISYLEKNYEVVLRDEFGIIFVVDRQTKLSHDIDSIQEEVKNVFGFNDYLSIVNDWLNSKRDNLTRRIYEFLKPYRVALSRTDWITLDALGNQLTAEKLFSELKEYYDSEKIIETFYLEWRENKIIEECEKMMQ